MEEDPPPRRLRLGESRFESVNKASSQEPKETTIEVRQILKDNVRATHPGEKPLDLSKRRSRRKRDYWISLAIGDGFFLTAMLVLPRSILVLLFGFAGIIVYTLALTWVMLFIMED